MHTDLPLMGNKYGFERDLLKVDSVIKTDTMIIRIEDKDQITK